MSIWNSKEQRINAWTVILWAVVGILVLWGLVIAVWGFRVATAGIYGAGEARIQIQSAEFRIAAVNRFFNRCAAIQRNEAQIDALLLTLEEEGLSQRTRELTLTQLAGVRATRDGGIFTYNTEAANTYTFGQFRDEDLPFRIPDTEYPEGGKTLCIATELR